MTRQEIKAALTLKDKSMTWLAIQLGYSAVYMYQVIDAQNEKELKRIKKILETLDE